MNKITVRNYRSFRKDNPVTLELREGITFILGVNNIGKSNLLKIFFELKNQFANASKIQQGKKVNAGGNGGNVFSQLLNQKSDVKEIYVDIELDGVVNKFVITPNTRNSNNYEIELLSAEKNKKLVQSELGDLLKVFKSSIYVGSFRTPNFEASAKYYDISIGSKFISEWDQWANGKDIAKRNKVTDLTDELKVIFNYDRLDISVTPDKKNLILKTEAGSFYLDEVGGSIGHFILVLGNALIKQPDYILIDEPENALHPQMQLTFITALASKAKKGIIATSHSIGLARSIADSIFMLHKDKTTSKLKLLPYGESYNPTVTSSLNELGYSQYAEIGGNNILLVEGRTDIKSFREVLRKYGIDQHFIIIDLGGANMINTESAEELKEIKRLNAKSYNLIIDSEISEEGEPLKQEFKEFIDICEAEGFNTFVTEVHSTENYISQSAINKIIGDRYPKLGPYEYMGSQQRKDDVTKWSKSFNWKMFREMKIEDLEGTKLDTFIKETLIPLTK